MVDLGSVLELMCATDARFRTLHGVVRTWRHTSRSFEAHRRADEARRGSSIVSVGYCLDDADEPRPPEPEATEERLRVWLELPDRLREECESERHGRLRQSLLVRHGELWWAFDEDHGALTNEGRPDHGHGSALGAELLLPAILLPSVRLSVIGQREVAGRAGIEVEARPRPATLLVPDHVSAPGLAGSELLVVDAERGVLLRRESLLDGEPYAVTEFEEIAFDEAFAEDTFVFTPPPGEPVVDVREFYAAPAPMPLQEVADRAPFVVLAPVPPPAGWQLTAHFAPPDPRRRRPARALLYYVTADASTQVNLSERAATGRLPRGDDPTFRHERRGERDYYLFADNPTVVLFERDGTRVQVSTSGLPDAELLDLCERLRRVAF